VISATDLRTLPVINTRERSDCGEVIKTSRTGIDFNSKSGDSEGVKNISRSNQKLDIGESREHKTVIDI
jgi:hypothetical protein